MSFISLLRLCFQENQFCFNIHINLGKNITQEILCMYFIYVVSVLYTSVSALYLEYIQMMKKKVVKYTL